MEKIPFVIFLYADEKGKRQIYEGHWPEQFIRDFTGKDITEIGGFYICGVLQPIKSIEDAFRICRG